MCITICKETNFMYFFRKKEVKCTFFFPFFFCFSCRRSCEVWVYGMISFYLGTNGHLVVCIGVGIAHVSLSLKIVCAVSALNYAFAVSLQLVRSKICFYEKHLIHINFCKIIEESLDAFILCLCLSYFHYLIF
jgi:hypothetical protein